ADEEAARAGETWRGAGAIPELGRHGVSGARLKEPPFARGSPTAARATLAGQGRSAAQDAPGRALNRCLRYLLAVAVNLGHALEVHARGDDVPVRQAPGRRRERHLGVPHVLAIERVLDNAVVAVERYQQVAVGQQIEAAPVVRAANREALDLLALVIDADDVRARQQDVL